MAAGSTMEQRQAARRGCDHACIAPGSMTGAPEFLWHLPWPCRMTALRPRHGEGALPWPRETSASKAVAESGPTAVPAHGGSIRRRSGVPGRAPWGGL